MKSPTSLGATKQDQLLQKLLMAAFAAMLVATPLLPSDTYSLAMEGQIAAPAMLWLMLAICATIALLVRVWHGSGNTIRWTLTDVVLGAFFGWVIIAGVIASSDNNRRAGWNMTASWVTLGATYYLARLLLRDRVLLRVIVVGILAITFMFAVEGLHEAFISIPQNQARFRQNPGAVLAEAGIGADPNSVSYDQFRSRLETQGPSATFALENSFAGFLVPVAVLLIGMVVSQRRLFTDFGNLLRFLVLIFAIIAIALCIRFTHSTAAMVSIGMSILIGGVAILFRDNVALSRMMRYVAFAVICAIFAWPVGMGFASGSVANRLPLTLKYRAEYWQSCWAMFADHPLWGCGPGNFQDTYPKYMLPQAAETIADPHNLFWEVACTSGGLGILLFAAAIIFATRSPISQLLFIEQDESRNTPLTHGADEAPISLRSLTVGGLAGISLALLLALSSGSNFLLLFLRTWLIFGAIPCVVLVAALLPWIRRGYLSSSLIWLAWLALAIHLTVSGGISNPGTGTLFFLLLAMAQSGQSSETLQRSRSGIWPGAIILVLLVIAGIAHYQKGYVPVLASQAAIGRAEIAVSESKRGEAKQSLKVAAEADSWSVTPLTKLTVLEFQDYLEDAAESKVDPAPLIACARSAVGHAPNSPNVHYELAMTLLQANAMAPQEELLKEARALMTKVTTLAPSKAVAWAYRAFAEMQDGDLSTAKTSASEAIRLDNINPHDQYDLAREPCPIPGRSFPGWLSELAGVSGKP